MKRRVVITGLGVIAPNGIGKERFWSALVNGKSGIGKVTRFDASTYPSQIAGEVNNFDPTDYMSPKSARRTDRYSQFAVACAKRAVEDARLKISHQNENRIGNVIGSAVGGLGFAEEQHSIFVEKGIKRISPFLAISLFPGAASSQIGIELGTKGYSNTLASGCAAGTDAIGHAFHSLRSGLADVILAGGVEAPIAPLTFGSFCVSGALSTHRNDDPEKASRPFDKDRDGFVMSEGAGIVVLEELHHAMNRGANIYAEILAYGTNSDGHHMAHPLPNGDQTEKVIRETLQDANLQPNHISYINAHGTSTIINDSIETKVIKRIFREYAYDIPISATKSMTGHSMGAGGAIEMIASVLCITHQFVHPTINLNTPDPECDLDYVPSKGRSAEVNVVLSNSLSFGGKNAVLIISRFKE